MSHVHIGEIEWVVIASTVLDNWMSVTDVLTRVSILTVK